MKLKLQIKRYYYSIDALGGLWISISILIIETWLLVNKIGILKHSLSDILSNNELLLMFTVYITTILGVPIFFAFLDRIVSDLVEVYREYVPKALIPLRTTWIRRRMLLIIVFIPLSSLSITLSLILKTTIFSLVSLLPMILFIAILLKPVLQASEHRHNLEFELPWFVILLDVIESVKSNINFLINRLRETNLLPSIVKEFDVIDRDSKLYFSSYIDAMLFRSNITPNTRFARFIAGYAVRLRSGSDVVSWLRSWINEELMRTEFTFKLYAERIAMIFGQLSIAIYVFIPLILASLGYFTNPSLFMLIPLFATPLLIFLSYIVKPRSLDKVDNLDILFSILALVVCSVVLYSILSWLSIIIGWIVAIATSIRTYLLLKECSTLSKEGLELLRDVVALHRAGYSISSALRYLCRFSSYSSITKRYLQNIVNLMEMGIPLTLTINYLKAPSFVFKYIVFALGIVHESGSRNIEVLEKLYESLRHVMMLCNTSRRIANIFDVFALVSAFILLWIFSALNPMISAISSMNGMASIEELSFFLRQTVVISMFGYAMMSTIIRRGVIVFEPRHLIFLATALFVSILIH